MNKTFFGSIFLFFVLLLGLFGFSFEQVSAGEKSNIVLLDKVANDYTKKFCNGIGFGLSKESAMNFAMKENKLTFKNKKGMDSLSDEEVATKIANSVIDRCGFPINLIGEEGIEKFKVDYISLNKTLLD
tara:strand:+ start:1429 stop:1815 length:387 start_codon:yes stop_codon:yes gene_type:complete